MLGRFNGLGITAADIIGTTISTQKTLDEVIPSIQKMSVQYERVSPQIDFATKYWATTLVLLFGVMIAGSTLGGLFANKITRR